MTPPLPPCPCCYRRHRSWRTRAQCALRPTLWVTGNPPLTGPCFASVSDCRGQRYRTVVLCPTREQAEKAKRLIDNTGCGGGCWRRHRVVEIDA